MERAAWPLLQRQRQGGKVDVHHLDKYSSNKASFRGSANLKCLAKAHVYRSEGKASLRYRSKGRSTIDVYPVA